MTTKIQFKLSNDVLLTVIQMVEKTDDYVVQSIKDALLVSIKEDLLAKLEDKAKNIQKQVSILDHNKKHAVVLKYHEAYTMYKLLELVYEKETFVDHPHIKKIKRLLVDLENKVESFTTEEHTTTDQAQTPLPVLASFPRLGVNEIIIEEATILEGEPNEEIQFDLQEEENNPVLDSTIDVNEIVVQNYSIFDLLEETAPVVENKEEIAALDVTAEGISTVDKVASPEEEFLTQEEKTEEKTASLPLKDTKDDLDLPAVDAIDEETMEETPIEIMSEETVVPSWAQQTAPPIFDGIVTKTSICIEPEDTNCFPTAPEEETLNLFEETPIPTQPQEEKTEKEEKKERKKPTKDNPQPGQISLF
ncbi:hypothetical protein [Myroides sp. DW712]|uniref:hypothetical protein n=1 Tax=Myroides sp. DW712 TaxID=3389800 RepID=UPI00397B2891